MQTQAQVAGQACIPQQNGNSLQGSSMGGWRKTWQTDADLSIRRVILENIFRLFQKRKPQVTPEWQQKLPDFVKRLEEQLYRDAASKEEYDNLHTLEQRLQSVAKRLTPKNNQTISHHSQGSSLSVSNMIPTPGIGSNIVPVPGSSSNMIPTPGGSNMIPTPGVGSNMVPTPGSRASIMPVNGGGMMPTPGHASTMIPTPGNLSSMIPTPGAVSNLMPASGHGSIFSTTGLTMVSMPSTTGNPLISQQGMTGMHMLQNSQLASSMALPALGSQMIPTPGLTASQMTANVSAVSGPQLQQPQFGVGSGPHIYRNMNGQTNGFVSNNGQRRTSLGGGNGGVMQLMANGQQLVNGNAMHSSASYLNATPYGNLQMQSQQRMNLQRQQHMRMQGDGYAMNAADLAGPANLSSTATSGSVAASSLGMNPIALQASKMIPVPGLPTQQQTLQPQSQVQPPQQVQHLQRNNFSSSPLVGRSQQQAAQVSKHTLSQSPVSSNFSGQKQPNAASQTEQQLPFNNGFSVVEQQQMHRQQPAQQKLVDIQQQRTSQPQGSQLELETVNRQGQIHQQLQSSQFPSTLLQQHPQKDSVQFKQQQQQPYSQPQPPQDVISQEQQEDAQQLKDQQFQQSEKLPLLDSQQLQEQLCDSPGTGSQSVPQSQSLNQSALNDPVEVVQAPSRLGAASAGGLASEQLGTTTDQQRMQQYQKQQRWLLFLRHASKCTAPEGQCQTTPHCHMAKQLWSHIAVCCERVCQYSRCTASRTLLHHHRQCREPRCPVCGPVRLIIVQQRAHASQNQQGQGTSAITTQSVAGASGAASSSAGISSFGMSQAIAVPKDEFVLSREAQGQPPTKRAKVEPAATSQQHMQVPQIVTTKVQACLQPAIQSTTILQTMNRPCVGSKSDLQGTVKKEGDGLDTHVARVDSQSRSQSGSTAERPVQPSQVQVKMELGIVQDPVSTNIKSEPHDSGVMTTPSKVKQEPGLTTSATTVPSMTSKSGKPKFGGTSLTELFTPEQIKEHIMGLRQWFGQSRAKAEKNQAMEHQMSESACHLCAVEKLTFEPPPIYCTPCGARIKRNALFYTTGLGETRHYFCIPCYNEIRSDMVEMDGQTYPKTRLEKRKNDEETEEAWVQCDKCNLWQHQVCALFNGRRNEGGEAEYTCPQCCMKEMEKGERKPLPPSAVLGARDLPKTFLSDHLEQRLARKLKNERLERARVQGKTFEEIPGAEALVVRVVSSVDKKLEVKQRFMEIFQEEDYPSEFPYKSKVVLLFQRIEGVEVCLFGMYVQEFGTECSQPNQRRVYLSYLDSVKYFRPDVRTVHGEALRTFVYHEILIGYLDYCKKRGFSSCYIWACPPLKGEDYILYCHPEIQKTPKSDKLREWYLTMLRKATTDGIVVEVTNLYDHFFVSAGECKAKVTAARLPYFDGDYWPGAAEDMIVQLQQEAEDGRRLQKKGSKKAAPKRACKLITQAEVSSNASKDLQLMHKLGDSILPMKEDFIMVHMHHACSHCCVFIVTGCRWVCKQCKNFQLCDRCYDVEQKLEEKDRHPVSSKEAHHLIPIEVNDVTPDTKDKDEIMESEFFDTRQAFLSLCQGNHYQYDTLRRAKHSSMMVLYHLHNPTAPAFVTTCNVCHHDIETGQGWRCETCPDFDVCNACYQKDEVKKHPHKLTPHPSAAERNAQNKEARQKRVLQLRKMLDLLVHASQCCAPQCQYPKCRSVKGLFRHGTMCRTRASGGCAMCKRMWHLLQLHARACKESECRVPRCKDLKEHLRRLQQQSESRRRAAVNEMMRQRAAEAAGTAS